MSNPGRPLRIKPVPSRLWRVLAMLALMFYLGLALHQLDLPGLNYDEALDAAPAVQTVLGKRIDGAYTLELAGRQWPLMIEQWFGPTTTYLLVAAFGIFGIGATTIRATGVFVGLISLLLIWGFLREYLDERAASLSILLLAVSPGFVFWSRMIAWVHLPLLPISVATIWLLFRWYSRRRARYLVIAAFGLGFGLQTHLMFLLVWGGLGLAWLLLSPWLGTGRGWRRWLWPWQITGLRVWGMSALALVLGAAPLLIYNASGGGTIRKLAPGSGETLRSVESYLRALPISLTSLRTLLSGSWFASKMGGLHQNLVALPAFGLALASILWLAARRRLSFSPRRVALFAILVLGIGLLRALVEGSGGIHHLLLVWPMPQALVAVALFSLADWLRSGLPSISVTPKGGRVLGLGALGLVTACLIGAETWTTLGYHRILSQTGGVGFFSDAINSLAQDLEQPGTPQPLAMDWGFRRNLQVLTQDRVDPLEWFTYSTPPGPEFEGYMRELIQRYPDALYLFHAPEFTAYRGHREIFEEVAYRYHLSPVLWKGYTQRDGKPVYQVYTLKTTPRLFEPTAIEHPLDVQLGDGLALLGFDLTQDSVQPGEEFELTLYWEAIASQAQDYKVFAHVFDDKGKLWSQHDDLPVYGSYPMTEWQTGEIVPDRITIDLGADVSPGVYHVFIGMYDESTGQRLPLTLDGQRLKGDTLGLAEITVEAPSGGSG
jgi:hypothetical protein